MTNLPYLDAHCHPTHPSSAPIFENSHVFAQSVTPDEWDENVGRASAGMVWGLGLHPLWLSSEAEADAFIERLPKSDAIGEIGLDYTDHPPLQAAEQKKILARILAEDAVRERLVSFHALLAYADVIDMIAEFDVRGAIIHWYSDSASAPKAIEHDIFFSVNDAMFADPAQAAVVPNLPVDRVLTETDAPYIQRDTGAVVYGPWLPFVDPTKEYFVDDSTRLLSGEVNATERSLGKIWKMSVEEVRLQIWRNFAELEDRVPIKPFGAAQVLAAASSAVET